MAGLTASVTENILDKYANVTYHISFFMLPEHDIFTKNWESSNRVVIAESGVSAKLNIESLEIDTYPSPEFKTGNIATTNINMEVREFSGASMLDNLFFAAKALGIRNYLSVQYFVEISFVGYADGGGKPDAELTSQKFMWPIHITNIVTTVDSGGSSYAIEAVAASDIAQEYTRARTDGMIDIRDVETVGDAIKEFFRILNEREEEKAVSVITKPDMLKSDVALEIEQLRLAPTDPTFTGQTTTAAAGTSPEKIVITIPKNSTIKQAINRIVSVSEEFQTRSRNAQTKSDDKSEKPAEPVRLINIATDTTYLDYDAKRGDYQMEYKYVVTEFLNHNVPQNPNENTVKSSEKADAIMKSNEIRKRYDYLYTGKNDQILNFDLKVDFSFYIPASQQNGLENTSGAVLDTSQHVSDKYRVLKELKKQINTAANLASTAQITGGQFGAQAIADVAQKINDADSLTDEERNQVRDLLSRTLQTKLDPPGPEPEASIKTGDHRFASQYNSIEDTGVDTSIQKYPVSYRPEEADTSDIYGECEAAPHRGPGRTYTSTMFETAFSRPTTGIISVNMDIKGDPYWLGTPQEERTSAFKEKSDLEFGAADLFHQQAVILFNLRTPTIPGDSGFFEQGNTMYSGLYVVRQVAHSFESGKFTQQLTMDIISGVDISEIPGLNTDNKDA